MYVREWPMLGNWLSKVTILVSKMALLAIIHQKVARI